MNKVFRVELFGGKTDRWCDLELPASYYGLQDALDKLQMPLGDKPRWEFLEHHGFQFLHVHLTHECDLYQLNALATCLGQMNGREKTAFEGLFNMEVSKKYSPISVATMIDLAYSTDCCHVVNASTDEQLGRFYAENDFIPALEKVPDSIFEYLDFEMLGRKARFEEGGVFASNGYVTQHTELKQVYETLDLMPSAPSYAIRLLAGSSPMDSDGLPEKQVYLNLPATQEALDHVLEVCEAPSWREMLFWTEDGAVPDLLENMDCDDIQELNELAKHLKCHENSGELSKLNELNEKLKEMGGEVVGINTDTLDNNEAGIKEAKEILKAQGASYKNLTFDSNSTVGKYAGNIMAFPTTVLVDKDGNIVGEPFMGGIDDQSNYDQLMKQIQSVLDQN